MNMEDLSNFTNAVDEICGSQPLEICDSQPLSLTSSSVTPASQENPLPKILRPPKNTGQYGNFRSVEEIDPKYRHIFAFRYFNIVQSSVIEDALYSNKSIVVCAPTGSGKTVVFEMAVVQLLMELEDKNYTGDFKIIYMAPVKALCTERLTEWHSKFTKLGLLCIEVTGDTDVDFPQLKPYRIIITTPEKWDMLTRRWKDHRGLVEVVKLFLIDEVHILNDEIRGPVLEAVVSRMKTIETSVQSAHRIEQAQAQFQGAHIKYQDSPPRIRFVAVSATVSNPEDVAAWLGSREQPAAFFKFGDECRPVKLKRVVEGYPCPIGTSIFKFDIILNYKLWPIIQKYHNGKPTLIFCNTRKGVVLTADTLSREITVTFNQEQKIKLNALASTLKNKKVQSLILSGVGCHHAGLLYEERTNIEQAFRNRDLPILVTTTTLAMGVNLPAHLVIIKNTQQYVNGAYQEYSISTVLQMVGRAGRPQFDTEATAVIMTRVQDKARYQALVGGCEPLQSYLHKRLAENLNSEAALGSVGDVAQCVQWVNSTFFSVRAAREPKRYLSLAPSAPAELISKKIEELCVRAMNGLESAGLITMNEACCIESTEAGRLMSLYYLDLETMKLIMKLEGTESLERLLWLVCESHELSDMHLRVDERRCLNALNRNNAAATIRFPMKGKISSRQMKLNCIIQAVLGCLPIPDPSLNQEAMKIMRTADRVCKCLVSYITRSNLISEHPQFYSTILNSLILAKCISAQLWENSVFVSRQLKGIGPTYSTLLASAGKTNFMILEESHPRDLERIMNKGPPVGNILRKQISLLPKYNLTMTPVSESIVRIQLSLLNRTHLAENMDNLTAGTNHKCYMIVGDSENFVLYFATFKESDLIGVYDGCITFDVTRKHSKEHKVFAHCISSSFVGIDEKCEYLFKDLNHHFPVSEIFEKQGSSNQVTIADVSKERKRRLFDKNDSIQFKEKRKRDKNLVDTFKTLKESLEKTAEGIKLNLNRNHISDDKYQIQDLENEFSEDFETKDMEEDKVKCILSEIENEIKDNGHNNSSSLESGPIPSKHNKFLFSPKNNPVQYMHKRHPKLYKNRNVLKKNFDTKNNFTFLDLLEKKNFNDEIEVVEKTNENCFFETVKSQIEKYLLRTKNDFETKSSIIDFIDCSNTTNKDTDRLQLKQPVHLTKSGKDATNDNLQTLNTIGNYENKLQVNAARDQFNKTSKCSNIIIQKKLENLPCATDIGFNDAKNNNYKSIELEKIPTKTLFNDTDKVDMQEKLIKSRQTNDRSFNEMLSKSQTRDVQAITSETSQLDNFKTECSPDDSYNCYYSEDTSFKSNTYEERIESINKYSFGETKVFDICAKNTSNQQTRIISKLKVDLDVTEIVYNIDHQSPVSKTHDFQFDIPHNSGASFGSSINNGVDVELNPYCPKEDKINSLHSVVVQMVETNNNHNDNVLKIKTHELNNKPIQNDSKYINNNRDTILSENTSNNLGNPYIRDIMMEHCNALKWPIIYEQKKLNGASSRYHSQHSKYKDIEDTLNLIPLSHSLVSENQKNFVSQKAITQPAPTMKNSNSEDKYKFPESTTNQNNKYATKYIYDFKDDMLGITHCADKDNLVGNSFEEKVRHGMSKETSTKVDLVKNIRSDCDRIEINDIRNNDDTMLLKDKKNNTSVSDILRKFSNTFKKEKKCIHTYNEKNNKYESYDSQEAKPMMVKRKYRIRDIDEIQIPLPQSIIVKNQNAFQKETYHQVLQPNHQPDHLAEEADKTIHQTNLNDDKSQIKRDCITRTPKSVIDIGVEKKQINRSFNNNPFIQDYSLKKPESFINIYDEIQQSNCYYNTNSNIQGHSTRAPESHTINNGEEIQENNKRFNDNTNIQEYSTLTPESIEYSDDEIAEDPLEKLSCDVMLSPLYSAVHCDINQVILNPKTLLECLNKEDIASKAESPEYCNTSRYSPIYCNDSNTDKQNAEEITHGYDVSSPNDLSTTETSNVFENYSVLDLTPSKEVETWTLSRIEDDRSGLFNSDTSQSYTMMHKNRTENQREPIIRTFHPNNSRQAKLSHYKFERKRVFKKT